MIAKRVATAVFTAGMLATTVGTVAVAAPAGAASKVTATSADTSARAGREGYMYNYYAYPGGCFSMGQFGQQYGMWGTNWICARQPSQYPGVSIWVLWIY